MLAPQEIRMRQALKAYVPQLQLEGQGFDFLYKNFRKLLLDNGIQVDERRLSGLKASHDYRNKVIHEGIRPSNDTDLQEIRNESSYIDDLIRMLEAKKFR